MKFATVHLRYVVMLLVIPTTSSSFDDPKKTPAVTLSLTRVRGIQYRDKESEEKKIIDVILSCDAIIDNQTGEELKVYSNFFSAFDGLRVDIYRNGKKVESNYYVAHQSPAVPKARPFVLKKGMNSRDLRIHVSLPRNEWDGLDAKLAGTLPGSAFSETLESNAVKIQRVQEFEPPKEIPPFNKRMP